jgi:hypothetical protein
MAFQRRQKHKKKRDNVINNEINGEEKPFLANGAIKRKP